MTAPTPRDDHRARDHLRHRGQRLHGGLRLRDGRPPQHRPRRRLPVQDLDGRLHGHGPLLAHHDRLPGRRRGRSFAVFQGTKAAPGGYEGPGFVTNESAGVARRRSRPLPPQEEPSPRPRPPDGSPSRAQAGAPARRHGAPPGRAPRPRERRGAPARGLRLVPGNDRARPRCGGGWPDPRGVRIDRSRRPGQGGGSARRAGSGCRKRTRAPLRAAIQSRNRSVSDRSTPARPLPPPHLIQATRSIVTIDRRGPISRMAG